MLPRVHGTNHRRTRLEKPIRFKPSEVPPPAVVAPGSVLASLGWKLPVSLLPVLHLSPAPFAGLALLFACSGGGLGVQRHAWDGPGHVTVIRAPLEVRGLVSIQHCLGQPVEPSGIPFSRRCGVLAFPTESSPGGGVEGHAPAVLVSASVRVAAPLGGAVCVEAGEAAVPGVEVQGGEVFGEPVLRGRRGGAPGRVDGSDLLVLHGRLGPPHRRRIGILVAEV